MCVLGVIKGLLIGWWCVLVFFPGCRQSSCILAVNGLKMFIDSELTTPAIPLGVKNRVVVEIGILVAVEGRFSRMSGA